MECRVSSEGKEVCGIHTEELYEDYLDGVSIDKNWRYCYRRN